MDNAAVLSAGGKIYARKRQARKDTVEKVDFDFEARKDFLTGFHKRKLERTANAREAAKARDHQLKLEARREAREERKRLAEERVAEMAALMKEQMGESSDSEDETVFDTPIDEDADDKEPKVTEFKTSNLLTTVTVVEDFELDDTYQSAKAKPREQQDEEKKDTKLTAKISKTIRPNKANVTKSKTKPKKMRNDSKLKKKRGKPYERSNGNGKSYERSNGNSKSRERSNGNGKGGKLKKGKMK